MDYTTRMALAERKFPELFPPGSLECLVQHNDWCGIFSGKVCNCVPSVTITTLKGKFAVSKKGDCRKLDETIPTVFDPGNLT
jgi:hypothetical protein